MNETRSTEQGVQEKEGKSAEQASDSTEQADQDGVVLLDVTKKYRSKRQPDVAISGDELWAGYGRGRQYDKLQSEYQKLQAQDQTARERLAEMEERVAEFETKDRLAKAMRELGVGATGTKATAQEPSDDWLTPNENAAYANVSPEEIASRTEQVLRQEFEKRLSPDKVEQLVTERVSRLYSIEQEKRDAEEGRKRAATKIRSAKLAKLKMDFPDVSESSLQEIVNADAEYMAHVLTAAELSQRGDDQGAIESYLDGVEKQEAALQRQLDLMQQQAKITADRKRAAELEAFSAGSLPGEEAEEEVKPEFNWHEGEKRRQDRKSRAKALVTRQAQLKNTGVQ